MKVLISVCDLPRSGGIARYVFNLCNILANENDVWVLTTHNNTDVSFEESELREISPNIKLISLGNKNKFAKYLSTIYWIRKIDPDILINNYNATVQYLLPFVPKVISVIHILHSDTVDFYRIGSINAKRVLAWIAPTSGIAERFNIYTQNKLSNRVFIIPHGVDSGQAKRNIDSKLKIIFAGVLYEHKGVKLIPQILKYLDEKVIDYQLTIVGGGILEEWLKDNLKEAIETGKVVMRGVVNHNVVYQLMSQSDIFLYPTYLDAFGLVIAEAMMNGAVPVVTHLRGVTDNLVDQNINGFLVGKGDVNGFVDSICQLANDKSLLERMSQNAVRKANEKFSFSKMKENYLNYFRGLADEKD